MISFRKRVDIEAGKACERLTISGRTLAGPQIGAELSFIDIKGQAGDGPTVLFTGGIHGDEYEGPAALWDLARSLDAREMRGRVLILPVANPFALTARNRCSPFDGLDMNRSFPGDPNGMITEAIAHWMVSELLPCADVVIDFHAGGEDSTLLPGPLGHPVDDPKLRQQTLDLMQAFAAPASLIIQEAMAETMWDHQVEAAGKVFITAELGSAGTLTPATLDISKRAAWNSLVHLGLVDGSKKTYTPFGSVREPMLFVGSDRSEVPLPAEGFFIPSVEAGDYIERGQPVGHVKALRDPLSDPIPVPSLETGHVYSICTGGIVSPNSAWWTFVVSQVPWSVSAYDQFETGSKVP